jgi:hypothetical protein
MNHINKLPTDTLLSILVQTDVCLCKHVCKKWKAIISNYIYKSRKNNIPRLQLPSSIELIEWVLSNHLIPLSILMEHLATDTRFYPIFIKLHTRHTRFDKNAVLKIAIKCNNTHIIQFICKHRKFQKPKFDELAMEYYNLDFIAHNYGVLTQSNNGNLFDKIHLGDNMNPLTLIVFPKLEISKHYKIKSLINKSIEFVMYFFMYIDETYVPQKAEYEYAINIEDFKLLETFVEQAIKTNTTIIIDVSYLNTVSLEMFNYCIKHNIFKTTDRNILCSPAFIKNNNIYKQLIGSMTDLQKKHGFYHILKHGTLDAIKNTLLYTTNVDVYECLAERDESPENIDICKYIWENIPFDKTIHIIGYELVKRETTEMLIFFLEKYGKLDIKDAIIDILVCSFELCRIDIVKLINLSQLNLKQNYARICASIISCMCHKNLTIEDVYYIREKFPTELNKSVLKTSVCEAIIKGSHAVAIFKLIIEDTSQMYHTSYYTRLCSLSAKFNNIDMLKWEPLIALFHLANVRSEIEHSATQYGHLDLLKMFIDTDNTDSVIIYAKYAYECHQYHIVDYLLKFINYTMYNQIFCNITDIKNKQRRAYLIKLMLRIGNDNMLEHVFENYHVIFTQFIQDVFIP